MSTTRETLFKQPAPTTKEAGIQAVKDLHSLGLCYHLDDDPADVVGEDGKQLFSQEEIAWLEGLITALNTLFADEVPEDEADTVNAGAWVAMEQAGCCESPDEDGYMSRDYPVDESAEKEKLSLKEEAERLVDSLIEGED